MSRAPIEWDDDALIYDYTVLRMSTPALGRKYGVHHASVHRRLLVLAGQGKVRMRNDREANAARRPRFTDAELEPAANELSVPLDQLRDVLSRHHIIAHQPKSQPVPRVPDRQLPPPDAPTIHKEGTQHRDRHAPR
ncbi:hypothetical protein [Streptomyces canus]|uniref:hypothetical protein n=1 Tax=Streptomyces canus TaxID=58343 RepID=UPI002783B585|nr:hypothetical protein [Streptomyces canus]MDQ0765636.1 hypothetical protein [Streptomyces canus]